MGGNWRLLVACRALELTARVAYAALAGANIENHCAASTMAIKATRNRCASAGILVVAREFGRAKSDIDFLSETNTKADSFPGRHVPASAS